MRKGRSDLSRSKKNQVPKGPESDTRTGGSQSGKQGNSDRNVRRLKDSENTRTRIEEVPEEQIPEWRRTALRVRARQPQEQNEQELPFMDVPAVTGSSAQDVQRDRERHVRFQEPQGKENENRNEPNFRRQAPVEGRTSVSKVAENVLKQPVTISLEELAGISPAL